MPPAQSPVLALHDDTGTQRIHIVLVVAPGQFPFRTLPYLVVHLIPSHEFVPSGRCVGHGPVEFVVQIVRVPVGKIGHRRAEGDERDRFAVRDPVDKLVCEAAHAVADRIPILRRHPRAPPSRAQRRSPRRRSATRLPPCAALRCRRYWIAWNPESSSSSSPSWPPSSTLNMSASCTSSGGGAKTSISTRRCAGALGSSPSSNLSSP